jgi:hypothetical protein
MASSEIEIPKPYFDREGLACTLLRADEGVIFTFCHRLKQVDVVGRSHLPHVTLSTLDVCEIASEFLRASGVRVGTATPMRVAVNYR